ncbi:MAG: hypothetical protein M1821_002495 [Bathelium mastoideum]|nr:MAG: hypothetical protein M1821_002495 [Bathelium mastoideum]
MYFVKSVVMLALLALGGTSLAAPLAPKPGVLTAREGKRLDADAAYGLYEKREDADAAYGLYEKREDADAAYGLYEKREDAGAAYGLYEK